MKAKNILLIFFLICFLILPINAETLTGTLGGTVSQSVSWTRTQNYASYGLFSSFYVKTIEASAGTSSLIRYDNGYKPAYTSTNISGNQTPFTISNGGDIIGSGIFGYMRNYNSAGVEQNGYQYFLFSEWNVTGLTGDKSLTLSMSTIDGITFASVPASVGDAETLAAGNIAFLSYAGGTGLKLAGIYQQDKTKTTLNPYTVTKPQGLGIQGTITKLNGIIYSSQAFVYNATTGALIAAQSGILPLDFSFNIANQTGIIIGIKDPYSIFYNSSVLFSLNFTPSTPSTPVSGDSNTTTITIIDSNTFGLLSTPNINVHNLITSNWSNVTINPCVYSVVWDTPIDIFVSKTGYLPNSLTNVLGGDRDYGITLIPIELNPFPNTTLLSVLVMNNNIAISGAYVQAQETFNGSVINYDGYTNNAGVVTFIINNDSVVKATASKSGFSASTVTETITGQTYAMLITLNSPYIIPTSTPYTIPPTVAPTITSIGGTVISSNATVCNATSDGTIIGELKKNIACMGFKDYLSQSLALAALIVMVFMLVGGRYGKGLGTALGAVVGFVLSLALGIIPFWVFVALIILAVGAVAFKAVMG